MCNADPYWKLRPPAATPANEVCSCQTKPPIILVQSWGYNPIKCLACNGEVEPSTLGFDAALAEKIAFWHRLYKSIDYLWLDSKEYEAWAEKELSDPNSPPNQRGVQVQKALNPYRKCYFWWFQEVSAEKFIPLANCPLCNGQLVLSSGNLVCEDCQIILQATV